MTPESEKEALTSLGLTSSHARVYLALAHDSPSKVRFISKVSRIHRAYLYQILRSLEANCFVERKLKTGMCIAIPLKGVNAISVKHRRQEITKLDTEVNESVDCAPKRTPTLENKPEIILTSEKNHTQNKGQKHFEGAASQILCNVEIFRENGFNESNS